MLADKTASLTAIIAQQKIEEDAIAAIKKDTAAEKTRLQKVRTAYE